MRSFWVKMFFFFIPVILIATIVEFSLRRIPNVYLFKKEYLDTHSDKIETLILGSSHTYYGINPVYISNCFNASHVSQSLNYDYEILKKYDNKWEELKTVIIPISYFTLYRKIETGIESWRVKNYSMYYGMNTSNSFIDDTEIFCNKFEISLNRIISYYLLSQPMVFWSDFGWGTSYESQKSRDLEVTGRNAAIRHSKLKFNQLDENISILISIIALCKKHNAEVLLFTPPAFQTYRKRLDKEQLGFVIQSVDSIVDIYDNCTYENLIADTSFRAKDYYDADHLNEIGAKKLSLLINKKIIGIVEDYNDSINKRGGVVITFDDHSVDEWASADSLLSKHNWKATFCISKINTLTEQQIQQLKNLQGIGHEIAGHGCFHYNAIDYVKKNGLKSYINEEIKPMINYMDSTLLKLNSFAYPYGSRNSEIDEAMLDYFQVLRDVTYGTKEPSEHNCFFDDSSLVFGLGIDSHYEHFSLEYLVALLNYSKINDKILILYSHMPVQNVTSRYQTNISTLELICNYINDNKMRFYTLSDLADKIKIE